MSVCVSVCVQCVSVHVCCSSVCAVQSVPSIFSQEDCLSRCCKLTILWPANTLHLHVHVLPLTPHDKQTLHMTVGVYICTLQDIF